MKPLVEKLRICLDARLTGTGEGIETIVIGLAHGLSQLTDGDEEYQFLVYPDANEWIRPYLSGSCKPLYSSPSNGPRSFKTFLKKTFPGIRALWHRVPLSSARFHVASSDGTIEKAGVDVMHFTFQGGFLTNIPSIYHPHDLQHLHLPQFFSAHDQIVREKMYRTLCNQAVMVPTTSTWVKNDLIQHYGLPEEKVKVIVWPPILAAYPVPTESDLVAAKHKLSLPDAFIFYPAQTWPHKNHIRLLEAMAILKHRYGLDIHFVSSGKKTEFFSVIHKKACELGIEAQTQFLGFVDTEDLQCLYRLCRCVVVPTKFEALSGPVGEAFSAGAPVTCSNVTSLPEQVGDAALLFDPDKPEEIAESIYRLWTNESLRQSLIVCSRNRIAGLSWERTARIFRAHYRRIAGRALTDEDKEMLMALAWI